MYHQLSNNWVIEYAAHCVLAWQANLNLQNFDEALRDFKAVLEVDPDNKAAKNQLVMTTHKIKQIHNREKQMYAGMFQKFAEIDAKVNVFCVSYVFTYATISYTVLSLFSLLLTNLFNVISLLQQYYVW